jgi:hypothetical protein
VAIIAGLSSILAAAPLFESARPDYAVDGTLSTSDGQTFAGVLSTTGGKPLRIFERGKSQFVDFTLKDILRIDVAVEEEQEEPYWYWKQSGSDEKVFTGKSYPWRKYITTVTLLGGRTLTGDLDGLLYIVVPSPTGAPSVPTTGTPQETGPRKLRFLLHKRDKGEEGQKAAELVYVTSVTVTQGVKPAAK